MTRGGHARTLRWVIVVLIGLCLVVGWLSAKRENYGSLWKRVGEIETRVDKLEKK